MEVDEPILDERIKVLEYTVKVLEDVVDRIIKILEERQQMDDLRRATESFEALAKRRRLI